MKEEKNIDDLFRSSFEDFEVAPPAAIKEAIDRRIDARPSRRKTWWLFLLALIAGSGLFAYVYTTSSTSDTTPVTAVTNSGISSTRTSTSGPAANGATTGSSAPGTRAATGSPSGTSTASAGNTGSRTAVTSAGRSSGTAGTTPSGISPTSGKTATGSKAGNSKKKAGGKKKGNSVNKSGISTTSSQGTNGNQANGNEASGTGGNDPSSDPKGDTPPIASTSGGNGANQTTPPSDSLPVKEDPQEDPQKKEETLSDSTSDPATKRPEKKKPAAGTEQWRASVYLGPQLAWGKTTTSSEQQRLSGGKTLFQFSGEINRSLFAGYGLSTGLQYSTKRSETFEWDTFAIDSTLTIEWEYIYGNPNFPDSITDSVLVENWEFDTTTTTGMQRNSISSFGIPLYITKQFAFGDHWSLLVNAGAQFNFYNVKLGPTDSIPITQTVNDFGTTLIGRVHVAYKWNQWQFSAGLNGGYDLKLPIVYEGVDRRRYFVTPQIAVHFVF